MTSVSTFYFGSSIFIPTTQRIAKPAGTFVVPRIQLLLRSPGHALSSPSSRHGPLVPTQIKLSQQAFNVAKTDILTFCSCHHFTYDFLFYSASQASISFLPDPRPHYSFDSSLQHRSGKQCALECTVTSWALTAANLFASPPLALQLCCHLPVAPQPEGPGHSGGSQLIRVKGRSTKVAEDSSNKAHGREKTRPTCAVTLL